MSNSTHLRRLRDPSVVSLDTLEDVRIRGSIRRNSHREMDEMAAEIRELKTVIQVQGEMIRRILDALEGKGKQRAQGSVDGDSQDDR